MRTEVNEKELGKVAGGRYAINNKNTLYFETIPGGYPLKCSRYQAMEEMDKLIGKYPTEQAYDQACFEMLKQRNWI